MGEIEIIDRQWRHNISYENLIDTLNSLLHLKQYVKVVNDIYKGGTCEHDS